jgi:CDP-4-dehydro-6-deoxyglucose reductase
MILLASGTGFAPIQAIVEQMQAAGSTRPAVLYWGGRRPADLYRHRWCEEAAATMPNLRYVPVVSDALPEDAWAGRSGFVHLAVMDDFPDLSHHEIYACGAPIVVDSARRDFVDRCNLPAESFYADSFTSEADKHGATA